MMSRRRRLRGLLLALAAVAGIGFGLLAYATGAFRSIELNSVDTRFAVRGQRVAPTEVVVVGVDAETFQALGDERWPFSHDEHAAVVDRLRRDGATVIALDIQFSEPSTTDAETIALLDAVERAGNVVVATTEVDDRGNGNAFNYYVPEKVLNSRRPGAINDFLRRDLRVAVGNGNLPTDPSGVLRRVPLETDGLMSFPVAVAQRAGGRIDRERFDNNSAWIDFSGPPGAIEQVSYSDVRLGRFKPGTFRNKIVVVGATAPVLQDVHPSSTSGSGEMSGPEIQAQAIATVLADFPLQASTKPLAVLLIVLLGGLAPVLSLRLSAIPALALAAVAAAMYVGAVQLAFDSGAIVPLIYPLAALSLGALGALAVHYVTEAFERERTRDLFARFVPEAVVGQVLAQADGVRLGGVSREVTVMFSDLRGFTSFAESLEPDVVITILNRYLTAMVDDAILCNGGTLVDYMGDGIMAVFGAPIEMDGHADAALAAARDKLRELERFNEWLQEEHGFEKRFQMGIGLNSGRVMSGNVGSEKRMAYTAIGDTTNTAARLEAMTKGTPHTVLLSETTRVSLRRQPEDLIYVDEVEIRGREQKVKLWSFDISTVQRPDDDTFPSIDSGLR